MYSQNKSARSSWPLTGFLLVILAMLGFSAAVIADEVILADGVTADGSVLLIGDKKQWDTFVDGAGASSASGYLAVERDTDGKAIKARWNGKGEAQFFLPYVEPKDYTEHLEQNAALVILLQVESPPKKKLNLRMGCGYPCAANADISKLMKALPTGEWVRLSFDLKCFAENGLDITKVDTPLLLSTRGKMALSIADVRMVPGMGKEASIRCQ